ncbi:hypothetical protein ACFPOH_08965 [Ureibacillus suwonensis]|uniref:Uncharacterized protein n=1 Tax=Ureibacillus suwonensis TaxID=313007 RepID=A0ABW0RD00_9BACL
MKLAHQEGVQDLTLTNNGRLIGENHCSNDVFGVNLSMLLSFVLDLDGLLPPNHYKGFFCVWIIFQKIRFI